MRTFTVGLTCFISLFVVSPVFPQNDLGSVDSALRVLADNKPAGQSVYSAQFYKSSAASGGNTPLYNANAGDKCIEEGKVNIDS